MNINFEEMEYVTVEHFKGGEGALQLKIISDDLNKIIMLNIAKGNSVGYHQHTDSSEIIYVISGTATICYEGETADVTAGQSHYCPKGKSHGLTNLSDEPLVLFAVVPNQ